MSTQTAKPPHRGMLSLLLRWGMLLLMAGYLLFSHLGCHGDEDNELFAALARAIVGR